MSIFNCCHLQKFIYKFPSWWITLFLILIIISFIFCIISLLLILFLLYCVFGWVFALYRRCTTNIGSYYETACFWYEGSCRYVLDCLGRPPLQLSQHKFINFVPQIYVLILQGLLLNLQILCLSSYSVTLLSYHFHLPLNSLYHLLLFPYHGEVEVLDNMYW